MKPMLEYFRPDCEHCLLIAEVAQTHDGSLGQAHAFIDAAADAGAGAIKFQTHIANAESTPGEPFRTHFSRQDATRYDYWRRMEFTQEQWKGLADHARDRKLHFLSSPFSFEAVELLEKAGVAAWKIASGEVGNIPMLKRMTSGGLPMLLSTGISDWEEIARAVELFRETGNPFALFQTTTMYPTPPEKLGLNVLSQYRERFGCAVGLSDHSGTIFGGLAARALGARFIEVHLTLSRYMFGPDVSSSVTVEELAQLSRGLQFIATALSSPVDKAALAVEMRPLRQIFRKSIVARTDLPAGKVLSQEDLVLKKPGTGIAPDQLEALVGRRINRALKADEQIRLRDID
jgi:N-acetylneuraminate synthase